VDERREALVLGIGNVLWADEGFGVRAVEALHERWAFPEAVTLLDGGTLGLALYELVAGARRVLVLDAVDCALPPGTVKVLRDAEVPAWGGTKFSPHQTAFNDILALAQLNGRVPDTVVVIGVQPAELEDLGGSLRPQVKARIPEVVELAARELSAWGFPGRRRERGESAPPLNDPALAIAAYETGRPSAAQACRIGDARLLATLIAKQGR
jgi:hydrogenase maturation protease